jgi:hypothetical protein
MAHSTVDSSAGSSGRWHDVEVLRGLVTAMFAFALATAVEGAEKHRELPMPPWAYGALALTIFFVLFLSTWAFRSVGNRH